MISPSIKIFLGFWYLKAYPKTETCHSKLLGGVIRFQNRMNKIKISSLEKQTEFRQIRLKFKSRLMRHWELNILKVEIT